MEITLPITIRQYKQEGGEEEAATILKWLEARAYTFDGGRPTAACTYYSRTQKQPLPAKQPKHSDYHGQDRDCCGPGRGGTIQALVSG